MMFDLPNIFFIHFIFLYSIKTNPNMNTSLDFDLDYNNNIHMLEIHFTKKINMLLKFCSCKYTINTVKILLRRKQVKI